MNEVDVCQMMGTEQKEHTGVKIKGPGKEWIESAEISDTQRMSRPDKKRHAHTLDMRESETGSCVEPSTQETSGY